MAAAAVCSHDRRPPTNTNSIAIIAMVDDGHQQNATSQLAGLANQTSYNIQANSASSIGNNNNATVLSGANQSGEALAGRKPSDAGINLAPESMENNRGANYSIGASATTSINANNLTAAEANKLHREPLSTIFPASRKSVKTPLISQEKFHWDQVSRRHRLCVCVCRCKCAS